MNDRTDSEENAANIDSNLSSILISSQTGDDSTNESTTGAEGGDQFLVAGADGTVVKIISEVDKDGRNDTSVVTLYVLATDHGGPIMLAYK